MALAALLSGTAGAAEAQRAPADTVPATSPSAFQKRIVPRVAYLGRVVEAAIQRDFPELEALAAQPRSVVYARRYGISRELAATILDAAHAEGLDPELAFRLVRVESTFKERARGPAGALGLVQLMPSTARAIDRTADTEAEILEPRRNLRLGFRYLRWMIERYDGDVRLGLLAYNRGEGSVDRALRGGRDPENGYSHRVLGTRSSSPYRGKGLLPGVGE